MAIHMPSNNFDPFARDLNGYTPNDNPVDTTPLDAIPNVDTTTGYMALPAQEIFHDHTQPSNLRGADELANNVSQQTAIADSANLPTQTHIKDEGNDTFADYMVAADNGPVSTVSEMSLNLEEMKGYAQLVFPDGEYLVTSTEIMLGRDERAQQILKEQEKRQRRILREQTLLQQRQRLAELNAKAALESYKLEPDADGSADGRRGSSASSGLEGRPAPGLPSTFSETGGIVNYEDSVDDPRRRRNKRRHLLLSRSSSTNSVAPASLHVYGAATTPWGSGEDEKGIFLPIHPFQIEDIRKISKEHLRIFYDAVEKHWKMEIKGNGAFVLNELYKETVTDIDTGVEETAPRHFKRGDTVILTHNTEVLVTSLTFLFKLPQRRGLSTFDSDDNAEDDLETSPTQQRTDVGDDEQESELSDVDEHITKQEDDDASKRPKILLKASKPKPLESDSPEPPRPTGGKGKKKPSDAAPALIQEPASVPAEQANATAMMPPVFDANSTLQHVPVNELPEKRKGPGRPPKNGLVSKRDEGIIRRKMKEYEKRGERPPPYKDILAIVRAENRAKELAARAVARGEPMPPQQLDMMNAVPTTELGYRPEMSSAPNTTVMQSTEIADNMEAGSHEPEVKAEMLSSAQSQPQQQRTYKSPSPMKPKEEYTEEQLKRPTQTYYYILDEILTEGPEDAMELQQIYDKICKKYPFYKYVVESTGWQSSVRHNLKQNERFKPVSKQGKGWLWAIDPAVPLDKEKKKKPTPPPMSRPPMPYQQQAGMQYGTPQTTYQGQYGTQYANGQQQYQSGQQQVGVQQTYNGTYAANPTYGQPTQAQPVSQQNGNSNGVQAVTQQQPSQPAVPRNLSHPPSRPASRTPQPTAGPPGPLPPAFQDLVEEIMRFRVEYLSPFGKDPAEYARHERIFKRCVEWISQLHMRQNPEVKFENDEEKRVFQILEKMRHKFEQGSVASPKPPAPPPSQQNSLPAQPHQGSAVTNGGQQIQPGTPSTTQVVPAQPAVPPQMQPGSAPVQMTAAQPALPASIGHHAQAVQPSLLAQGVPTPAVPSAVPPVAAPIHAQAPVTTPATHTGDTPVLPPATNVNLPSVPAQVSPVAPVVSRQATDPNHDQPPSVASTVPQSLDVPGPKTINTVGTESVGMKRSASIGPDEHDEKRQRFETAP